MDNNILIKVNIYKSFQFLLCFFLSGLGQFNHPTNYQPRSFHNNNYNNAPPSNQFYPQNNYHLPTTFRPRNE